MADDRLQVAFVWHMHQPYYREPNNGTCNMPWVRLHATKDYYFLPNQLAQYPKVKANFNLVPSLLKQIHLYNQGDSDAMLELSRVPASDLTSAQRRQILHFFFFANTEHMIQPYPGYSDLLARRGSSVKDEDLESRLALFSDQDFLDLQVWYNWVWIDPLERARRPELQNIPKKGRGFTEAEKLAVLNVHADMLKRVIPQYRALQEAGQIELTTTPFYHPILPLLCDTEVAREAMFNIQLPERFVHPEDAREQIRKSVRYHQDLFGAPPAGMWPSEGSVSPQVAQLIAEAGIQWIATDEEILGKSLAEELAQMQPGQAFKPDFLYRPYRLDLAGGHGLNLIFRDHELSDQIGFVYGKWDPKDAVANLMHRLRTLRESLRGKPGGPHLVSIILDGENAWEYYPQNGLDFFHRLYEALSQAEDVVTVRVGDFLREHPPQAKLPRLFSGSWINHNFKIWIGHPEDNTSWNYLSRTRQELEEWEREHRAEEHREARDLAWEALYMAEGSDWNWWYGDDHSSNLDMEFDQLYRDQLAAVYRAQGNPIPDFLLMPIRRVQLHGQTILPTGLIQPELDGKVTDYFEWLPAGYIDLSGGGGAMHQAESIFQAVYFGFDLKTFYLRIDFSTSWLETHQHETHELNVRILQPQPRLIRVRALLPQPVVDFYEPDTQERWTLVRQHGLKGALDSILELAIPFADLQAQPGEKMEFWAFVKKGDRELERCPQQGPVMVEVPGEAFAAMQWSA
ncbi:MAG: glycoside hydrolase [Candidatus Firestonebacteria bacterium]|nr:glycoside hydrolase [Candidatus Firestonebacteria bacterium]